MNMNHLKRMAKRIAHLRETIDDLERHSFELECELDTVNSEITSAKQNLTLLTAES